MKGFIGFLIAAIFFVSASAFAQVASAEILGVAETRAKSPGLSGLVRDDSVGEVVILIRALDAAGNPVADAPLSWSVKNSSDNAAYVVGSSASMSQLLERVFKVMPISLDGGVTDANGEAYLVVDSSAVGDMSIAVNVGGVDAKTYDGGDMRVVWF